ncbi:MAG: DUF1926 domain-containing protein [Spirochaetaceae bacterium]|jgi:hypothetical protein|nr:DUF1926 domain-containing protein [Spirochaetaceae bacterium]
MSQTIRFILGFHYHIPLSAGDEAFEDAYAGRLKPFISALYKYPKIQAALHYSGVLLHWLERAHPEFFMLIGDLVSRKQVELLGGGFYEPMLPLLPLSDRIGQIELLTTYLRKQFGKRPQGCMLPLMAWEPQLVGPLNVCGMKYTFLDEGQFRRGGLSGEVLTPSITEDQGKIVAVFPVLRRLGAAFGERRASEVLASLLESEKERLLCVFPERFFTDRPDYGFHQFFEDLSAFDSRIEFTQPSKAFKNSKFLKKTYFPCSVQDDGFPETALPRRFLIDCPEANGIYAKMMFTHVLINQFRGDKSRKRTAREELWKAQGCDSFCSAPEGGVFRHSVRKAAYKALLEAEKITREPGGFTPSLLYFDFDLDGEGEYLFQGEAINCYIKPEGGSIFEFDYLPRSWNYLDTFNPEARRTAFSDRLVSPDEEIHATVPQSAQTRFCGSEKFELVRLDKEHGTVYLRLPVKPDIPYGTIEIEKSYRLKKDTLTVSYGLRNRGDSPESFQFVSSVDLSFPGEGALFIDLLEHTAETLTLQDIKNETRIVFTSDRTFDSRIESIRSPCPNKGVLKDCYQSTCIMLIQPVSLNPGEHFQTEFRLSIQR